MGETCEQRLSSLACHFYPVRERRHRWTWHIGLVWMPGRSVVIFTPIAGGGRILPSLSRLVTVWKFGCSYPPSAWLTCISNFPNASENAISSSFESVCSRKTSTWWVWRAVRISAWSTASGGVRQTTPETSTPRRSEGGVLEIGLERVPKLKLISIKVGTQTTVGQSTEYQNFEQKLACNNSN